MQINSLIYNLNYPTNIGGIIRTNHVLRPGMLYFYDSNKVFDKYDANINTFSVNISNLKEYVILEDLNEFLKSYNGRIISTNINKSATPLDKFTFKDQDLIIFGNERIGIPEDIIKTSEETIIIPMFGTPYSKTDHNPNLPIKGVGEYPTLNVSVSYSIVIYEAMRQLGMFNEFAFRSK